MPRLIDVDQLKKDWHMGDICETCSRDTRQCGNDYCFSRMDVCGMLDDVPTANGWISVKDKLPERKWIDYLVATRIQTDGTRGFNIAWLNDDNGGWGSNDEWICDGREIVTHWLPLPEPPKEEQDATVD